jgi:hypothetical protein
VPQALRLLVTPVPPQQDCRRGLELLDAFRFLGLSSLLQAAQTSDGIVGFMCGTPACSRNGLHRQSTGAHALLLPPDPPLIAGAKDTKELSLVLL